MKLTMNHTVHSKAEEKKPPTDSVMPPNPPTASKDASSASNPKKVRSQIYLHILNSCMNQCR